MTREEAEKRAGWLTANVTEGIVTKFMEYSISEYEHAFLNSDAILEIIDSARDDAKIQKSLSEPENADQGTGIELLSGTMQAGGMRR